MRKRLPLADALALSTQISLIEETLVAKRLTQADIDQIATIVERVSTLEKAKVIVAPPLLHRVKALAAVARRFRALGSAGGRE